MLVLTIAGREVRSLFGSTIGWLVLAGFLAISGLFWSLGVSSYVMQSAEMLANPYAASQVNLTDQLLAPYFLNIAVILLMISPALSMWVFSDELKSKTLELLMTSPVSTAEIVLGKFLGTLGFLGIMLLGTFYVPISLWIWGDVDSGALFGGYLSVLAVGSGIIALGTFFSAMTESSLVAMISTFAAALALWLMSWSTGGSDTIAGQLSLVTHIENFLRGAVPLSDLTYYLVFIAFFLFAAHQRVEAYRWR